MKRRTVIAALCGIMILAYLATGWVVVRPGEVVVVRRLGRVLPRGWGAGPHWGWPWGFDTITRVRTDEVRRLSIGLTGTPGPYDAPDAGEFLTGDLNLLRAEGTVQYRVADPSAFVLRTAAREPILQRLTETALSRALSRRGIDGILREQRSAVARDVETELARAVARHQLGITILGVSLTDARPPTEVAPDFAAAQAARSERDRRRNEAKTYEATTATAAQATAHSKTEQARAYSERTLALAKSKAGRFVALLAEADRARGLTVRRLYRDALRDLLPKVQRKLVLTPEEGVDLSILGIEK